MRAFNRSDPHWLRLLSRYPNPTITNQMLTQLRKIAYALKNSTTILLPKWYQTLAAHKLPQRMMPHDVSTRWNSTYDMLNFAVTYHSAIDTMTAARDLGLRNYELDGAEWKLAGELREILMVRGYILYFISLTYIILYRSSKTRLYSSRGTPSLATVFPAMDHIDKVLMSGPDSPYKFSIIIRAALAIGKQTMNQYYNKTDHSEVYCIAMGKVPLFEFSCQCLPTILLQFSTPVTSLNISRPRNGKMSGSMPHATSFVKNSTVHTRLLPLGQETQVLLAWMLCRWTALT